MFQLPLIQHKRYFSYTNLAVNFVHYIVIQHTYSTSFMFIGWETGFEGVVNSILKVSGQAVRVICKFMKLRI